MAGGRRKERNDISPNADDGCEAGHQRHTSLVIEPSDRAARALSLVQTNTSRRGPNRKQYRPLETLIPNITFHSTASERKDILSVTPRVI